MEKEFSKEKELTADFLRSFALTHKEQESNFKRRLEAISKAQAPLKRNEAKKALKELYEEASALTLPFGKTVEDIMKAKGLTKMWRGKEILDVPKAVELTGLSKGVFQTNMWKDDCVVDMSLVVSLAIGFKLSPVLTDRLLQSAGLAFRLDNPEHIAYMFLLEYCQDLSVQECNSILDALGVRKTRQLGSHSRGQDGHFEGYNTNNE